ncbi:MAG: hypothetical protein Q9187_004267 [Circinaria calcarea]
MRFSFVTVVGALAVCTLALPASVPHVVHERRSSSSSWSEVARIKPDGRITLPVRIGITQNNLERGHDFLMDISDPSSENYGKHWTAEQIAETFAPSAESVDAIRTWLTASGIDPSRVSLTHGRNWLHFNASIAEVESLLHTKYKYYAHEGSGQGHLACDEYSVPKALRQHVDMIMPTVHFDTKIVSDPSQDKVKRDTSFVKPGSPDNTAWQPKKGKVIASPNAASPLVSYTLANCNQYITPDCLRALYNFPNCTLAKSSYGIVEYTPQAFLQSDLNLFYSNLAREIPSGTAPIFASIDGGVAQTTTQSFRNNAESDLDLDDSPYPDPSPGGYKSKDCGRYAPASVISTSYGYNEADLTAAYEQRQCYEYMKLGLAGVSVLYSSGDYGVAGNGGQCCSKAKCAGGTYNSGATGTFNPSFPGTCPYVTSVGATQIVPGASVTAPEEACETVIYSGGGFSNVFPLPSYQSSAVKAYFTNHQPAYTATQYNNSQTVRGYPDISANGANYVVAVDGTISLIYGTSASSPTLGSIITLINEQRVNGGKSAVGFLNPTLYANPSMLNDITSGGNQGCGTPGFTAVTGWDPVTGLGTPNYQKMLSVFMALP